MKFDAVVENTDHDINIGLRVLGDFAFLYQYAISCLLLILLTTMFKKITSSVLSSHKAILLFLQKKKN